MGLQSPQGLSEGQLCILFHWKIFFWFSLPLDWKLCKGRNDAP